MAGRATIPSSSTGAGGASALWGAAGALAAVVAFVAVLPLARDPSVVEALEVSDDPAAAVVPSASSAAGSAPAAATATAGATASAAKTAVALPPILQPSELAPTEVLDRAVTIEALRALAEKHPKDPKVITKLVKALATSPAGLHEAVINARRVFELDAASVKNSELQVILKRAASGQPATSDLALDIMASSMDSAGPDLLFELSNAKGVAPRVRERAIELGKSEAVRKVSTPQLRIAVSLRDRSGCERAQLFAEAEKTADARSLQYLTPLQAKKGCGLFRLGDCYGCLGNRVPLNKAITAIKNRTK